MIRLAHPVFTRADWERLWPVLESGNLVQGPAVRQFEAGCAAALGVDRVVAVSSGTAALHLALALVGVADREVVLPAFGWPSAANVTEWLGGSVRLVDIAPDSLAMDPALTAQARSPKTAAVVPIHPFGQALSADEWLAAAGDVPVVEDAACAFRAHEASGRRAGTWGRLGCFSLHPRKGLTTGEGGLLVAQSPDDLDRLAQLRNLGIAMTAGQRSIAQPGLNYRMNELAATLGLGQLDRHEAAVARRRELAGLYLPGLEALPGIVVPAGLSTPGHVFQSLVVAVADGVDRDRALAGLHERGVQATIGTVAVHLQPYYRERYGLAPEDFPVARWAQEKTLALPMHERLSNDDVDTVLRALEASTRR